MSVALYFDVCASHRLAGELRRRGVDVLTARDDKTDRLTDAEILDRATGLGRPVFTHDPDFLREATLRQQAGTPFAGVIFVAQPGFSFGKVLADLELIAKAGRPDEFVNTVQYLPL